MKHSGMRALLPGVMGALLLVLGACAGPPVQALSNARQALIAAQQAGAPRYAPAPYAQAQRWLDDAEFALQGGDFGRARESALRARDAARAAASEARRVKAVGPGPETSPAPASASVSPGRALSPDRHNNRLE